MSNQNKSLNGRSNSHAFHSPNGHAVDAEKNSPLSSDDEDDVPLSSQPVISSNRALKRKKPVYAESSSSDDDTPLASSSSKPQTKTTAVPMPGAVQATTVPVSHADDRHSKMNTSKPVIDDADDSDGDSDAALSRVVSKKPPKKKVKKEEDEDEVDVKPPAAKKKTASKRKRKVASEDLSAELSSADEKPLAKKAAPKKTANGKTKKEESDDKEALSSKKRVSNLKKEEPDSSLKKGRKKKDEDEDEEVFKWWEESGNGDGSVKWTTLEHQGVIFPPPYEPLPSHVKMKYQGKILDLPPASEEVAGFYAAMLETDHAQDATFNRNFFNDWKAVLKNHPPRDGTNIAKFELCDFRPMYEWFEEERTKKKALTAAEKKELKKTKDEMEAKYTTCLLDGRKEKVGNFRVEPPGLFRGRGEHPKKGSLKLRVRPEDITINIGRDAPIPVPNMSGNWKSVIHDNTVTWLANWTENVNGNNKYVFLAAGSSLKGQSDMNKFEKARELKKHVDRIRQDYERDLKDKVTATRQRATAMYFIDKLALRAGNEKGEDEADTVGCCSLRCEHVTLQAPNIIVFDFLGKDSIRYYNQVTVEHQVFKNVRIFKKDKQDDDNLFDRVTTGSLNKHLQSYMKGLTAKVFRTYNASITFQRLLDENSLENATLQEKLNAYNHANRLVAILCNHQRSAPKTHEQSMEKMRQKIRALKYDRMKLRHVLFSMDPKYKKKFGDDESDIDDEWIAEHEADNLEKEIEKAEKKFAKTNEKKAEDGEAPEPEETLREKIKEIKVEFKRLEKERGTKKATLSRNRPADKVVEGIEKLAERIRTSKLQMQDRDAGKEVALGTSKINYLDPRITCAWAKIHDVPIEKMFSKTLLVKFPWAREVDDDWKF